MRRSIVIVACVALLASGCQASATPAPSATSASGPSGPTNTQGSGPSSSAAATSAEPSANGAPAHWVEAGGSGTGELDHAVLLGDGRVLVLSDILEPPATSAQTWDPATNAWRPTEGLNKYRSLYVAVPMAGGLALVTGGETRTACRSRARTSSIPRPRRGRNPVFWRRRGRTRSARR